MRSFFEPVTSEILDMIKQQVEDAKSKNGAGIDVGPLLYAQYLTDQRQAYFSRWWI
jgi:hypothetical protein